MSSVCDRCVHKEVCEKNDKAYRDCDPNNRRCRYYFSHFMLDTNYTKYKNAIERMGEFGRLFVEYDGCPCGHVGRYCGPLEKEIMSMGIIKDVDGGEWIPVNKGALVELVGRYRLLAAMAGGDPFAKAYEREDNE